MSDTVKMDLAAAITHKGVAYGPGEGIEVPRERAEKMSATETKAAKAETKATKGGKK
jgi:hypothetical protein